MIVLTEAASNPMLDALARRMDGGTIELLSDAGETIAVLRLANPAAHDAIGSTLTLNPIAAEDAALLQGRATTARVLSADSEELLLCDVGDTDSDAVVKFADQVAASLVAKAER